MCLLFFIYSIMLRLASKTCLRVNSGHVLSLRPRNTNHLQYLKICTCPIFILSTSGKKKQVDPVTNRKINISMCANKNKSYTPEKKKSPEGSPIKWWTVLICLSFGTIIVLLMKYFKEKKEEEIDMETIHSYGTPKLGGDFELVDHNGNVITNKDFLGKWVLIYFGFTHCPDICPEELEKMGNIVNTINRLNMLQNIQPVFISIDPERDSPGAVKAYISVSFLCHI